MKIDFKTADPFAAPTPITDLHKRTMTGFADEWVPRYVSEELERAAYDLQAKLRAAKSRILQLEPDRL